MSIATAYRYLHEGVDAIAAHTPDLHEVIATARAAGLSHLCLDGTLVPTDRVAARTERGNGVWYSGKHCAHGSNWGPLPLAGEQMLTDPGGFPLGVPPACGEGVSAVRPGCFYDLACARELVLPALCPHTALGPAGHSRLPVLADKGYIGAGIGVRTSIQRPKGGQVLDPDTRIYNALLTGLRAPTERANALLQRWHAIDRVTLNPWAITQIAAAALVLTRLQLPIR